MSLYTLALGCHFGYGPLSPSGQFSVQAYNRDRRSCYDAMSGSNIPTSFRVRISKLINDDNVNHEKSCHRIA